MLRWQRKFCLPIVMRGGLAAAGIPPQPSGPAGRHDLAACPQIRAWHHDHHLCRSRAGGRKRMRGLEVNPDARKCGAGAAVPGPGTACAGAGPDLTPAAARELEPCR
jgi:hypothetical protein